MGIQYISLEHGKLLLLSDYVKNWILDLRYKLHAIPHFPTRSFAVQFGDHFRSGDHLRSGIICGAVQYYTHNLKSYDTYTRFCNFFSWMSNIHELEDSRMSAGAIIEDPLNMEIIIRHAPGKFENQNKRFWNLFIWDRNAFLWKNWEHILL